MVNVMRPSKQLKGTGVYVNKHLTKKNAKIATNGCILREQNKNKATWSRNGVGKVKRTARTSHGCCGTESERAGTIQMKMDIVWSEHCTLDKKWRNRKNEELNLS